MNFFKKFNKLKIKKESDKKRIVTLGATILGVLIVLTGTSAAYLVNKVEGSNNKIVAGELVLSISGEDTSLNLAGAVPLSDSEGLNQEETHNFSLENTGSINAYYEIRLLNDCTVGSAITIGNESVTPDVCIPDNYVKVGIKKDDGNYSVKTIGVNGVVFSGNIEKGETLNFSLKLWLDYNTPNDYQGITQAGVLRNVIYNGQISLYMRQLPTNIYTGSLPYSESDLASDWQDKTENETSYLALYTLNTKKMPETYTYNGTTYTKSASIDVSEQGNGNVILGEYTNGSNMIAVIGQDGKVMAPSNCEMLFAQLNVIETIDLSNFDTSNVIDMSYMFYQCSSLTKVTVGCEWQTTTALKIFEGAGVSSLTRICNGVTTNETVITSNLSPNALYRYKDRAITAVYTLNIT